MLFGLGLGGFLKLVDLRRDTNLVEYNFRFVFDCSFICSRPSVYMIASNAVTYQTPIFAFDTPVQMQRCLMPACST